MPYQDYLEGLRAVEAFRRQGAPGQDRDGRGQPAPGHLHRQEIHQSRPLLPRPDPGRQHGPDEGGREIRIPPRLQVFHLRHLVDSPGHHPLHRRPGPHHPHPGAHDRNDQQADARRRSSLLQDFGREADAGGNRRRNADAGRARPRRPENGAAADLAAIARRRQRRHQLRRFHRGQSHGKSVRHDQLQPAEGQAGRRACAA